MRVQSSTTTIPASNLALIHSEFSAPGAVAKQREGRTEREPLIAAAAELFTRLGFRATTLRQIALTAGCPQSAIRREFGNKTALLEAVLPVLGPSALPQLLSHTRRVSLRDDICQLVEWETNRMREQKEFLDRTLIEDSSESAVMRIAGTLSFSNAHVILARFKRHQNLSDAERQFLMCAIQAVGFALGFVKPSFSGLAPANRFKQLARVLADSIERHHPLPARPESLVHSLWPV